MLSVNSAKTWGRREGRLRFQKGWFVRAGHQGRSLSNFHLKVDSQILAVAVRSLPLLSEAVTVHKKDVIHNLVWKSRKISAYLAVYLSGFVLQRLQSMCNSWHAVRLQCCGLFQQSLYSDTSSQLLLKATSPQCTMKRMQENICCWLSTYLKQNW